jgi:Flp pilus assembly pilin Flp
MLPGVQHACEDLIMRQLARSGSRGATSIEYALLIAALFILGAAGAKALGAVMAPRVAFAASRISAPTDRAPGPSAPRTSAQSSPVNHAPPALDHVPPPPPTGIPSTPSRRGHALR